MSVFIENKILFPPQIAGSPVLASCHLATDIFVIISYNDNVSRSSVVLFNEQGTTLRQYAPRAYPSKPDLLAWHPKKLVLAVAWKDCKLSVYDFDNDSVQESGAGTSPYSILSWNKTGSYLVAAQKNGQLTVWENQGGLRISKPVYAHTISQDPTSLCYLEPKSNFTSRSTIAISPSKSIIAMAVGKFDVIVGCRDGKVFHLSEFGKLSEIHKVPDAICSVRYYEVAGARNRSLFVMTENNRIIKFELDSSLVLVEKLSIALTGRTPPSCIIWLDADTLAVASVEEVIRVWDLRTSQNLELKVSDFAGGEVNDVIRTIGYSDFSGQLCAATNSGRLLFWSLSIDARASQNSHRLAFLPRGSARTDMEASCFSFSSTSPTFLAVDNKNAYLMKEHELSFAYSFPVIAVQSSGRTVHVLNEHLQKSTSKDFPFIVLGIAVHDNVVAIWGDKETRTYTIENGAAETALELQEVSTFQRASTAMYVYKNTLIAVSEHGLARLSLQGIPKSELKVSLSEGTITSSCMRKSICAVATSEGHVKVVDFDKNDGKQWTASKVNVTTSGSSLSLSLNEDCSSLAFCTLYNSENRDVRGTSQLFSIWDIARNSVHSFRRNVDDVSDASGSVQSFLFQISDFVIGGIAWSNDQRLLTVHFRTGQAHFTSQSSDIVATFFASSEKGIVLNSYLTLDIIGQNLMLGCTIPFIYLFGPTMESKGRSVVSKKFLPDFKGFKAETVAELQILMDFCYYSCIGKIVEALSIVKNIHNPGVWHHLAVLCVRMGRMEYAKICLGKLRRADILRSLRIFSEEHQDLDSQLGYLATLLELTDESKLYFAKSGSKDLLVNLQLSEGKWDEVLGTLTENTADRLSRRNVLFTRAEDERTLGDSEAALESLKAASCERFDIPRLLLRTKSPKDLQAFIDDSADVRLLSWYGSFLEAENDVEGALEYYEKAKDFASVVRILNASETPQEAMELVKKTNNPAAAFQLAHSLEFSKESDPVTLIGLYKIAGAFGNAIRICIKNDMEDKIMELALKSEKVDMLAAARYMESKSLIDKAITLYQKAGQLGKATELAFSLGYYTNIEAISEEITADSDALLVQRCVEYFVENNQVDRAVHLLLKVDRLVEAFDLFVGQQMTLTAELVALILERSASSGLSAENRTYIMQKLIDSCLSHGLYLEAARMLLENGQPEAAMNALARTGDVEAVSRYIRIIRDPDALIVAGNILQSHPWHQKRQIFDSIVLAYKRAGAHLYLASFYDSWGETACESGRYDIAKEAFKKSLDVIKAVQINRENQAEVEAAKQQIDTKAKVVDYYLETQAEIQSSPKSGIAAAEELLRHSSWTSGVRTGHLYGLIITAAYTAKAMKMCKTYMQKLEDECPTGCSLTDFVDEAVLSKIS